MSITLTVRASEVTAGGDAVDEPLVEALQRGEATQFWDLVIRRPVQEDYQSVQEISPS